MGQDQFRHIPNNKILNSGLKVQKADYEVRGKPL